MIPVFPQESRNTCSTCQSKHWLVLFSSLLSPLKNPVLTSETPEKPLFLLCLTGFELTTPCVGVLRLKWYTFRLSYLYSPALRPKIYAIIDSWLKASTNPPGIIFPSSGTSSFTITLNAPSSKRFRIYLFLALCILSLKVRISCKKLRLRIWNHLHSELYTAKSFYEDLRIIPQPAPLVYSTLWPVPR